MPLNENLKISIWKLGTPFLERNLVNEKMPTAGNNLGLNSVERKGVFSAMAPI